MKNGSNHYFNKWISDVKWALKTNPEVKRKIKFYESMLGNVRSLVFDSIGSSSNSGNKEEQKLINTLDKLETYKNKKAKNEMLIKEHIGFLSYLEDREILIYTFMIDYDLNKSHIAEQLGVSRGTIYNTIKRIEEKYWKHVVIKK